MALGLAAPARADDGPSALVEGFHAALLEVMKQADRIGARERYQRLEPSVTRSFHLALMIRIASGRFWGEASEGQQQRLVSAFSRLSVGNYANRFDGYSGEAFETSGQAPGPGRTVLVTTRIVRPDDDPVEITYVTKPVAEGWRIVDVLLARGVSELAVRRSEYQSVLQRDGIDGLIDALEAKADELVSEPASG